MTRPDEGCRQVRRRVIARECPITPGRGSPAPAVDFPTPEPLPGRSDDGPAQPPHAARSRSGSVLRSVPGGVAAPVITANRGAESPTAWVPAP